MTAARASLLCGFWGVRFAELGWKMVCMELGLDFCLCRLHEDCRGRRPQSHCLMNVVMMMRPCCCVVGALVGAYLGAG